MGQFLRAFLPRLSISSEVGQCVARRWSGYATMYVPGIEPSSKTSDMTKQFNGIIRRLDKDNQINVTEVFRWFSGKKSLVQDERSQYPPDQQELFAQFKAEDTVAYHDTNDDMAVSRQELWDSLVQWNAVR